MKLRSAWHLLKKIFAKWLEDDPFQSAAALSYYTLFSLAPLLIISIAVAGFVFGREAAQNQIVSTLQELIGQESAQAIQAMIQNASNKPKTGKISTLFGGIILLFGAGGVVGQLQTSLNTIWQVKAQSDSDLRDFLRKRFVSFAMVLGVGFLLLVSLAVSAFYQRPHSIYRRLVWRGCSHRALVRYSNLLWFYHIDFRHDLQVFA